MNDPHGSGDRFEARTPPSRRHPDGLPRCRRVITADDGTRRQCSRTASWQLGSPVCGVHGGGWPVRVARGERRNPITASLGSGRRAADATLAVGLRELPDGDLARVLECEQLGRAIDANHRRVSQRSARALAELYAINGRTRGRPSREDVLARRAFGFRLITAALNLPFEND